MPVVLFDVEFGGETLDKISLSCLIHHDLDGKASFHRDNTVSHLSCQERMISLLLKSLQGIKEVAPKVTACFFHPFV
jgi:hypothetical protein